MRLLSPEAKKRTSTSQNATSVGVLSGLAGDAEVPAEECVTLVLRAYGGCLAYAGIPATALGEHN
jgi:hypothetical protein